MTNTREENALDLMYEHLNECERAVGIEPTPKPMPDMGYETGFMPLNRRYVVIGTLYYSYHAKSKRKLEIVETDSSILADMAYAVVRGFLGGLLDGMEHTGASFSIELIERTMPPANSMMFTGAGTLYQYKPDGEVVRSYDSRVEGIR